MRPTVTIDCIAITSEEEFWQTYLDAVEPQGREIFGRNLDAFWDAIEGAGPGWLGEVNLHFVNVQSLWSLRGGKFLINLRQIAIDATFTHIKFD